jgi:hypothetical protein
VFGDDFECAYLAVYHWKRPLRGDSPLRTSCAAERAHSPAPTASPFAMNSRAFLASNHVHLFRKDNWTFVKLNFDF